MSEVSPASYPPAAGEDEYAAQPPAAAPPPAPAEAEAAPPPHTVADPAPLGLAAFAMTTFALSMGNANIWPAGADAALALALAYGGLAQFLAGMWEFKRRNTFGALAFTSYGSFWISYYVFVKFVPVTAADAPVAVGVFLLGWTIFTFYMILPSTGVNGAVAVVFILLTITFALLTIGAFRTSDRWTHWGGYIGLATAAAAWYTSFAGVTNETFKKTIFPVFPLRK
jgi:succinate-acetate transporter protein